MTTNLAILAYNDQFEAASRHARHTLTEMAHRIELNPSLGMVPLTIGSWLRDQLCGVVATLEADTATYCKHLTNSHGPQVMYTAAWRPGHFVCPPCVPTLRQRRRRDDFTCDQCGTHTDTIHPRISTLGPILFAYARCTRCLDPLTGD